MFKRNQAIAAVTAVAFALTSAASAPAFAGTAPQVKPATVERAATDFSARKRHRSYRNDAAAAAMVGAIISGVTAYAAAREYRKAQERAYYGYGPRYSYAPYYGPRGPYPYY